MIVVDSSVWIDHFRDIRTPQVLILSAVDRPSDVLTGDLVLLELLQGARNDRHAKQIEGVLREFAVVPMMSEQIALEASLIYRALRADGKTLRKTIDLIIATFCIVNGYRLLQADRDFVPIAEKFHLELV